MTPKIPRHQSRCVAKEVGGGVTVLLPGRSGSLRWKQFVVKKSPVWFSGPHPINMCGSVVRLIICGVLHTTGFRFMRSGEWSASLISGIKKGDNRLFRKSIETFVHVWNNYETMKVGEAEVGTWWSGGWEHFLRNWISFWQRSHPIHSDFAFGTLMRGDFFKAHMHVH